MSHCTISRLLTTYCQESGGFRKEPSKGQHGRCTKRAERPHASIRMADDFSDHWMSCLLGRGRVSSVAALPDRFAGGADDRGGIAFVADARGPARSSDAKRTAERGVCLPADRNCLALSPLQGASPAPSRRRAPDRSAGRPGELLSRAVAAPGVAAGPQIPARGQQHDGRPVLPRPVAFRRRLRDRRSQGDPRRGPRGAPRVGVARSRAHRGDCGRHARLRHAVLALSARAGMVRPVADRHPHLRRAPVVGAPGRTHHHRRAIAAVVAVSQQQSPSRAPQAADRRLVSAAVDLPRQAGGMAGDE